MGLPHLAGEDQDQNCSGTNSGTAGPCRRRRCAAAEAPWHVAGMGKNKKKKAKGGGGGARVDDGLGGAANPGDAEAGNEDQPVSTAHAGELTVGHDASERPSTQRKVVSREMQETTERIYEAVAEHLSEEADGPVDGSARGALRGGSQGDRPPGFKELEEMGLFSDTKGNLQRQLREHKLLMLAKDQAKTLSLQDVGDHNTFLTNVRIELTQRKEALTKRARLISVLLNKTLDNRRAQALHKDMQRIRVAEKNFNEDISAFNAELAWFHATPTFQKAQEHVQRNFVNLGKGEQSIYVHRHEIEQVRSGGAVAISCVSTALMVSRTVQYQYLRLACVLP